MAYISFGNKELFEFVEPEKYLQKILSWKKKHIVRFEKPRWKCPVCGKKGTEKQVFKRVPDPYAPEILMYQCKGCERRYTSQCMEAQNQASIKDSPWKTTRHEVGDIFDPYWRVRVPKDKKEWIAPLFNDSFLIENYKHAASHNKWVEKNLSKLDSNYRLVFKPAHNLSDIIGKAVITKVYGIEIAKDVGGYAEGESWILRSEIDGEIVECINNEDIGEYGKWSGFTKQFAIEDGFDSPEQFFGYFGSQLKEGESKTGTVYVYEKYKEE